VVIDPVNIATSKEPLSLCFTSIDLKSPGRKYAKKGPPSELVNYPQKKVGGGGNLGRGFDCRNVPPFPRGGPLRTHGLRQMENKSAI